MENAVILIGDSIRMGYQDDVRRELAAVADVWWPQENGGTSANVLDHLREWVLDRDAGVVHINCGLHDLKKPFDSSAAEIPIDRYAANVRAILSGVQTSSPSSIVIWANTTPVNESWHHRNKGFDRFEEDVRTYNAAALEVARDLDVPVHDLYSLIDEAGRDRLLTEDGVHFDAEGSALLGAAVARFVRSHLA